jgi:hypothetical protein
VSVNFVPGGAEGWHCKGSRCTPPFFHRRRGLATDRDLNFSNQAQKLSGSQGTCCMRGKALAGFQAFDAFVAAQHSPVMVPDARTVRTHQTTVP